MIDATIALLPAAPLHVLEVWSEPRAVAARVEESLALALPPMGQSADNGAITLIRFEPTVWLVEGEVAGLAAALGEDGALTAIGGGIVRVSLSGPGWRRLLMEGGVFDAENPAFNQGCSVATVIDRVNVRLHVVRKDACIAYVPASYAHDLAEFWRSAITCM